MANFRAIEEKHEHGARDVTRDTRTLGERVGEVFANQWPGLLWLPPW